MIIMYTLYLLSLCSVATKDEVLGGAHRDNFAVLYFKTQARKETGAYVVRAEQL